MADDFGSFDAQGNWIPPGRNDDYFVPPVRPDYIAQGSIPIDFAGGASSTNEGGAAIDQFGGLYTPNIQNLGVNSNGWYTLPQAYGGAEAGQSLNVNRPDFYAPAGANLTDPNYTGEQLMQKESGWLSNPISSALYKGGKAVGKAIDDAAPIVIPGIAKAILTVASGGTLAPYVMGVGGAIESAGRGNVGSDILKDAAISGAATYAGGQIGAPGADAANGLVAAPTITDRLINAGQAAVVGGAGGYARTGELDDALTGALAGGLANFGAGYLPNISLDSTGGGTGSDFIPDANFSDTAMPLAIDDFADTAMDLAPGVLPNSFGVQDFADDAMPLGIDTELDTIMDSDPTGLGAYDPDNPGSGIDFIGEEPIDLVPDPMSGAQADAVSPPPPSGYDTGLDTIMDYGPNVRYDAVTGKPIISVGGTPSYDTAQDTIMDPGFTGVTNIDGKDYIDIYGTPPGKDYIDIYGDGVNAPSVEETAMPLGIDTAQDTIMEVDPSLLDDGTEMPLDTDIEQDTIMDPEPPDTEIPDSDTAMEPPDTIIAPNPIVIPKFPVPTPEPEPAIPIPIPIGGGFGVSGSGGGGGWSGGSGQGTGGNVGGKLPSASEIAKALAGYRRIKGFGSDYYTG